VKKTITEVQAVPLTSSTNIWLKAVIQTLQNVASTSTQLVSEATQEFEQYLKDPTNEGSSLQISKDSYQQVTEIYKHLRSSEDLEVRLLTTYMSEILGLTIQIHLKKLESHQLPYVSYKGWKVAPSIQAKCNSTCLANKLMELMNGCVKLNELSIEKQLVVKEGIWYHDETGYPLVKCKSDSCPEFENTWCFRHFIDELPSFRLLLKDNRL